MAPADHDPSNPAPGVPPFDPDVVPVVPAATVLLVDDRMPDDAAPDGDGQPTLHVLMVQRTARLVFAPAAWVFPGGRVDPDDHADQFDDICDGLSDIDASRILDVERGGLAWWIAACRETLEEAGLLMASNLEHLGEVGVDLIELRDQVRAEETVFVDLLIQHGLRIDATLIEEVARFITPHGSPRRFDARFFVAHPPDGQEPHHDDGEIVAWEWVEPAAALERWRAGEFEMISPTVRMVECLTRYANAEEVMAVARERRPYQRVRVIDPAGEYRVVLPGEDGYETAELEVESGWVRF